MSGAKAGGPHLAFDGVGQGGHRGHDARGKGGRFAEPREVEREHLVPAL